LAAISFESGGAIYPVSAFDLFGISETQSVRFFWEPVDDISAVNWQNLDTVQFAGWAQTEETLGMENKSNLLIENGAYILLEKSQQISPAPDANWQNVTT
jgi:hypothetical protein